MSDLQLKRKKLVSQFSLADVEFQSHTFKTTKFIAPYYIFRLSQIILLIFFYYSILQLLYFYFIYFDPLRSIRLILVLNSVFYCPFIIYSIIDYYIIRLFDNSVIGCLWLITKYRLLNYWLSYRLFVYRKSIIAYSIINYFIRLLIMWTIISP